MRSLATTPTLSSFRRAMVEVGRRLYDRGLIVAAEGNLSARLADGTILVTPAAVCKGRMAPEDLIVVDAAGNQKRGARRPSTELPMHLTVLRARPDAGACVHAHPPYATAFAVAGTALPDNVLPEIVVTLGSVPLAEYATPSTAAVGTSIEKYLGRCDAILLKNHGVLTIGSDLEDAFCKMEMVERFAQIVHLAQSLGSINTLTHQQVDALRALMNAQHSGVDGEERTGRGECRDDSAYDAADAV